MAKNLTIYDISKLSGFSPKTVARVVNGEKCVKAETEEKIKKIIEDSGFVPNAYAKNLKIKKDKTILISIRTTQGFPLQWIDMIVEKIAIICLDRGVTLLLEYLYDEESIDKSIMTRKANTIDGVIVFYEAEKDVRIKVLREKHIPFVVFERSYDENMQYVGNDNYAVMYDLFSLLCDNGLKRAELLLRNDTLVNKDRVNGVLGAFFKHGLSIDNVKVTYGIGNSSDAYKHILTTYNKDGNDFYFVSGDERAVGVYKALNEKGVEIGKDVSIVGFDDIPTSSFLYPSLSTIRPNYESLAERLVDIILPEREGEDISSVVPAQFIQRDSIQKKYIK